MYTRTMHRFTILAALFAGALSRAYAVDDQVLGIDAVDGLREFAVDTHGRAFVATRAGEFVIDGDLVQVARFPEAGAPRLTALQIGEREVAVSLDGRPLGRIQFEARVVHVRALGTAVGATFVETVELGADGWRRLVHRMNSTGSVVGIATVPMPVAAHLVDLAIGADGRLWQARGDADLQVVPIEFGLAKSAAFEPFAFAPPAGVASSLSVVPPVKTRAAIISDGVEFVRPQHLVTRARAGQPATPCTLVDRNGNSRTRSFVFPADVPDGSLMSVAYSYGGNDGNTSFATALLASSRYVGNTTSDWIGASGYAEGMPCPLAAGVDCSGLGSQLWGVARFGTSTVTAGAGTDIGSATAAQPGDIINLSGVHQLVLERWVTPSVGWFFESTVTAGWNRAVRSRRNVSQELSNYRAIRRVNVAGEAISTSIACNGCTGTGEFLTAPAGVPLTFALGMSIAGNPPAAWVIDDALTRVERPDPIVARSQSYSRSFSAPGTYYVTAQAALGTGGVVSGRAQVVVTNSTPAPTATPLSNGVPVTQSLASTSVNSAWREFAVQIPAGRRDLRIATSSGGDVDLYVKFGGMPTLTSFDCRPYLGSGNEACTFATPSVGTYFVRVYGYQTGTVNFTITASWSSATANVPPTAHFSFSTSSLTANFTDSSTDSDGSIASRSWNFGDGTTSTATNPSKTWAAAGTYTVTLTVTDNGGLTHTTSRSVTVSSGGSGAVALSNGVGSAGSTNSISANSSWKDYTVAIPAGAANLTIATSGASGDVDLHVKFGTQATTSVYDCRPYSSSGNETCTFATPTAGTWYARVYGYQTGTVNFTIRATWTTGGGAGTVTEKLANGNFDAIGTTTNSAPDGSWTRSAYTGTSFNTLLAGQTNAHTGGSYAYLGVNASTSSQTVQSKPTLIPSSATQATLSFYTSIVTSETTTSSAYDTLQVQLVDAGTNAVITTLVTLSNLNKTTSASTYVQRSYNVAAYKGRNVRIRFVASADSSLASTFRVDTVSLRTDG